MSVYQNMNQFAMTPIKGANAANFAPDTVTCQVYSSTTSAYLVAGQAVALSTATGNTTVVDLAASGLIPFGYILAAQRKDKFYAGDAVEVALGGSIIYLEAGAAITRGDTIEHVPGTATIVDSNAQGKISGIALDNIASGALEEY